jgi:hypothetical protein
MGSLDIAPAHKQTVAADRRAPIWCATTVIAFIAAAGLMAATLDIVDFLQAGLSTEPLKASVADTDAERSGTWRHFEPVY